MTNEEYLDMVIGERITQLLLRKPDMKEKEVLDKGEKVINSLGETERISVEAYLNLFSDQQAEDERKSYLGGVRDGICLMGQILKLWKENGI